MKPLRYEIIVYAPNALEPHPWATYLIEEIAYVQFKMLEGSGEMWLPRRSRIELRDTQLGLVLRAHHV